MKRKILLLAAVVFCGSSTAFADWSVDDKGTWPQSWPEELEPLRAQSRTLQGSLLDLIRYEIPFTQREAFESAWPHLLKVKSKRAPVILVKGPYKPMGATIKAGVIIHCPPPQAGDLAMPEDPLAGPWSNVRAHWFNTTFIELVVDGDVVDLNSISLPAETPIFDLRFTDRKNDQLDPSARGSAPAAASPATEVDRSARPGGDDSAAEESKEIPFWFNPPIRRISADSIESGTNGLTLKGNVKMEMESTAGRGILLVVSAEEVTITPNDPPTLEVLKAAITYRDRDSRTLARIHGDRMILRQSGPTKPPFSDRPDDE